MPVEIGFEPILSDEDIQALMEAYYDFSDAILAEVKYYSADIVEFAQPNDPSEESHCYIKFQSFNPNIAENKDRNEIVLKFTGIQRVNIISGNYDHGKIENITFGFNDEGKIVLALNDSGSALDENSSDTLPMCIVADSVGWAYDLGDDLK